MVNFGLLWFFTTLLFLILIWPWRLLCNALEEGRYYPRIAGVLIILGGLCIWLILAAWFAPPRVLPDQMYYTIRWMLPTPYALDADKGLISFGESCLAMVAGYCLCVWPRGKQAA